MDGATLTMIVWSEITLKPKEEEKKKKEEEWFGWEKSSVQSLVVMNQPQSAQWQQRVNTYLGELQYKNTMWVYK